MVKKILQTIMRKRNFSNSKRFIEYLRKNNVAVGEDCVFFSPSTCIIDITRPYLLEFGNSVKVTQGVTILTHDFSYSVLRIRYGDLIGECSKTKIGNNCFIGMNSTIMPGVTLGNNVIVGAGSVVTKSFSDDLVIAGNPAHVICSLEEFYQKRKNNLEHDAITMATAIRERYHREPSIKEMESFFPLFLPRDRDVLKNASGGGYSYSTQWGSQRIFDSRFLS